MSRRWGICLLLLVCFPFSSIIAKHKHKHKPPVKKPKIVVVCTSALIENNYEMREQEYKYAFSKLREYGYEPYIFESCQSAPPSFLEEFSSNVIYTNVNDDSLKNKGVNEARSLIEGFKHCQFDGETMIIKMTGRYWFNSRYFLDFVENHPSTDAFVKFHEEYGMDHDVIAGCYAIKYKYFKELLEKLDLAEMEAELIPIEWKIGEQIRAMQNKGRRVMIMQKLDITANQGSPNPPRYFYW